MTLTRGTEMDKRARDAVTCRATHRFLFSRLPAFSSLMVTSIVSLANNLEPTSDEEQQSSTVKLGIIYMYLVSSLTSVVSWSWY